MKKVFVTAAMLVLAATASARSGGGAGMGAMHGAPHNDFGQRTAAEAREHEMDGRQESAAAKAKAEKKQAEQRAEKLEQSKTPPAERR